ncbi:MAG: hypothetical protein K5672_02085 [Bacteroidaceae bacterium]|nr:hypothetical protein [Bacteroidaceae bacterium]
MASGIGLNIQNALADYGISGESLSLVAKPKAGSNSNSNSNGNSNSNSDTTPDEPKEGWFCKMGALKSSSSVTVWISGSVGNTASVIFKKLGGPNAKGQFQYQKTTYVHYFNCATNKDSDLTYSECIATCEDH